MPATTSPLRYLAICTQVLAVAGDYDVAQVYYTSSDGSVLFERLPDVVVNQSVPAMPAFTVTFDLQNPLQAMDGYGAALTDAAAELLSSLKAHNASFYNDVLASLFDTEDGMGFSVIRVPISSTDLSPVDFVYTYDDTVDDVQLQHVVFGKAAEYIIPVLTDILAMDTGRTIKILLTPWSPPAWLKTGNSLIGGTLDSNMHEVFADYWVRVIQLFQKIGIDVYALTLQNEPLFQPAGYPGMYLSAQDAISVIGLLGPKLSAAGLTTKVLAFDHNWDNAWYPVQVLQDPVAYKFTAGTAFHCYGGNVSAQEQLWSQFPEKELHFTECSGGSWSPNFESNLQWQSANLFLGAVRQRSKTVLTWSLALDPQNGPNNGGGCTTCRGVVTIDDTTYSSVHYEVEWYGMGHYSRFLRDSSFALNTTVDTQQPDCLDALAFSDGPDSLHVVAYNFCGSSQMLKMPVGGQMLYYNCGPGLTTFNFPSSESSLRHG